MSIRCIRSEESLSLILLDKRILLNPKLSLEAKGAYSMLEANPDIFIENFHLAIIKELVSIGYLEEVKE
jgi:hypothetical protein